MKPFLPRSVIFTHGQLSTRRKLGFAYPPQFNPDGTFRIDGIPPGEYRVDACCIASQQTNTYVKEIRVGSVDLLTDPLVVSGPIPESLEIVFEEGAGEIK